MTVSSATSRVEYAGNGSTTAFAVPFYFIADGDLKVYVDATLQVITTNYTVSGAGVLSGGTVTFGTAPASGTDVVIFRDPTRTQTLDYTENDNFPAESHELGLDRLTMIAQRNRDLSDRAVRIQDFQTGFDPELPEVVADRLIGVNAAGTGLEYVTKAAATAQTLSTLTVTGVSNFGDFMTLSKSGDGEDVFVQTTNTFYAPGSTDEVCSFVGAFYQNDVADNRAAGYLRFHKAGDFSDNASASGYATIATRLSGSISERIRIDSDGIKFNGDTAAANALNDYEEGIHTATVAPQTSGTITLNSTNNKLAYTKIGRLVQVIGNLTVDSVSSPLGFFTISLPFAAANLDGVSGTSSVSLSINNTNAANIADFVGFIAEGNSSIDVYLGDAVSVQTDSAQEIKATTTISISASYFTA